VRSGPVARAEEGGHAQRPRVRKTERKQIRTLALEKKTQKGFCILPIIYKRKQKKRKKTKEKKKERKVP
jgi:hypothetical protein